MNDTDMCPYVSQSNRGGVPLFQVTPLGHLSQVELNRAMKGVLFQRVNHAALKLPPWAKMRWPPRRVFGPKAGILVRLRSLGMSILIRKIVLTIPGKTPVYHGKIPAFSLVVLTLFWP
jgi:hypothetical protein